MNTLRTFLRFSGTQSLCRYVKPLNSLEKLRSNGPHSSIFSCGQVRSISSLFFSKTATAQKPVLQGTLNTKAERACVFQQPLWHHQQVRTVKRGTEYQPKNIKRKRTHGWIKRISTPGGIEVILRRMLKGRKSLTH